MSLKSCILLITRRLRDKLQRQSPDGGFERTLTCVMSDGGGEKKMELNRRQILRLVRSASQRLS